MVFIPPLNPFQRNDNSPHNVPNQDPYTFLRPEDFFKGQLDDPTEGQKFHTPLKATLISSPRHPAPGEEKNRFQKSPKGDELVQTGAMFALDPDHPKYKRYLLIQFVRPTLFRLRFDPQITDPLDYTNENT